MYHILVCDDDKAILDSVEIYLNLEGYHTIRAMNGQEALKAVENTEIHCAILDIMMPNIDGLTATLKMREKHNFPIILLSAKSEDTDKITGLSFGADDYVTKPFNPLELMARVKSQIRRYVRLGSIESKEGVIITGGLALDTVAKELTLDGEPVRLTAREYGIVEYLMRNLGHVLSTQQIYEAVWNEPSYSSEKTVTVHILSLIHI
mgnify:FL=1